MTVTSNFKLDDRIKSINDIQSIICNDLGFIGCKGFFFDEFIQIKDLTKCDYGTLIDINGDSDDHCFKARDEEAKELAGYYRFFIPEKLLKPIKKKYRPFSLAEWLDKHEIGNVIHYRSKSGEIELRQMYVGTRHSQGIKNIIVKITLGNESHTLDYLFEDYEIEVNGEWLPFGVLDNGEKE